MLLPSVFGENLFDGWFNFPELGNIEKELYGRHADHVMKTDVHEHDDHYELDIDLPGFKKEEVSLELKDGYLTVSAAKGLNKEEKSEKEPLKIWGTIENGEIKNADSPNFTAQCIRVPVSNGHMGAVFIRFEDKVPSKEEILKIWNEFSAEPQEYELPSAPKQFLHYFTEDNMPQTKLHRDLEGGMAVSIGRLREDTQYDYKFVCLSHNTLRGAAGGAVLLAEQLCAQGYLD